MKLKVLILALFVAGLVASAALAGKPPVPPGQAKKQSQSQQSEPAGETTSTDGATTAPTTTAPAKPGKATSVHGNATSLSRTPNKVLVCKATGSAKRPYVLVRVAPVAAAKMLLDPRNIAPGPDNTCPTTPPGTGTTTTSTDMTTTDTTATTTEAGTTTS